MATVIDALLVTLGLDTKDYQKGQKQAEASLAKLGATSEAQTKRIVEQSKIMAEGWNKAKNELIGLVAIAAGAAGIKEFFTNMINGQAAIGRLAVNIGLSAKELDAWGSAAETVGGTAQGMQSSMQSILAGFEAFKLGEQSPVVNAFRALHVEISDANGKIRPMRDLLLDVSAALKQMNPQDQVRIAQMLGLDDGTLNLLREGRIEVEATVSHMAALSRVTDDSVKKAAEAQAQWAGLKRELMGFGEEVFTATAPALGLVVKLLGAAAHGISDLFGWISKVSSAHSGGTVGQKTGELIARALAYGGDKEANDALAANGVPGYTASSGATPTSSAAPGASSGARGLRNNNPGNLEFAGQDGATREDGPGRFAHFGSMEEGVGALVRQLRLYASRGINTIRAIVKKYAPAGENNVGAYVAALVRATGLSADQALNLNDEGTVRSLVQGIAVHENGSGLTEAQLTGGIRLGAGASGFGSSSNSKVETHIGAVNIHTQATDAKGIARDVGTELQHQTTMAMASSGMD